MTTTKITMSSLGTAGQWGNQVCQYAFIRSYAQTHGLSYEVPPWVGQYLFGFQDPPLTTTLPPKRERTPGGPAHMQGLGIPFPPRGHEYAGHDFQGWAQYETAYYQPVREAILGLYAEPASPQRERVASLWSKLQQRGGTRIGLHLRGGDSGRIIFPLTPIEWCLRWLHQNWHRFRDPVLYLATEEPSLRRWFEHYSPVLPEDLGATMIAAPYPRYRYPYTITPARARQLDFFPDWYLLQRCDVLLLSDSSFGFTAAWTSRVVRETWRMRLSLQDFEPIDPWNCRFCNMEHLDDHPGIPGTAVDHNPEFDWGDFRARQHAVAEDPSRFTRWSKPKETE
jgi:hypothetical protein